MTSEPKQDPKKNDLQSFFDKLQVLEHLDNLDSQQLKANITDESTASSENKLNEPNTNTPPNKVNPDQNENVKEDGNLTENQGVDYLTKEKNENYEEEVIPYEYIDLENTKLEMVTQIEEFKFVRIERDDKNFIEYEWTQDHSYVYVQFAIPDVGQEKELDIKFKVTTSELNIHIPKGLVFANAPFVYEVNPDGCSYRHFQNKLELRLEKNHPGYKWPKVFQNSFEDPGRFLERRKVLYAYKAEEPIELSLAEDELVDVIVKNESGWFIGKLKKGGRIGIFPENFTVLKEKAKHKPRILSGIFDSLRSIDSIEMKLKMMM